MASSDKKSPPPAEPVQRPPQGQEDTKTQESPSQGLDFGKLDLSVERVDERISPSETNVFDK